MYELSSQKEWAFHEKFQLMERTIEEKLDREGRTTLSIYVVVRVVWYVPESRFLGTEQDIEEAIKEIESYGFECVDFYPKWQTIDKLPEYILEFRR